MNTMEIMIGQLSMEPYDGPVTTIIWFRFNSELETSDGWTDEGKALDTVLSQISREPSWGHTLLATPSPASNERIAFIGKICPLYPFSRLYPANEGVYFSVENQASASLLNFHFLNLSAVNSGSMFNLPYRNAEDLQCLLRRLSRSTYSFPCPYV